MLVAITGVFASFSCSPEDDPESLEPVTIGIESTAVNSLIYIAREQGYFLANGLDATIRDDYPSGAAASEKVIEGELDFSTTAEFFIVRQALEGGNIVTIASIDSFMHMKLLVRKDRGIEQTADLKGKMIGVPVSTSADFMLGRYLDLNNIRHDEVTIVDVQSPDAVNALVSGEVDAVVTWQPNVIAIQEQLGEKVSVWDVQSGQAMYCVLLATGDLVRSRPGTIERLLQALIQAADYVNDNPRDAENLVKDILGYDDVYIDAIWPEYQFSVRLDQAMITAMEDQARWAIANNLAAQTQVPDFLNYIYMDALEAIKPEAVDIIH